MPNPRRTHHGADERFAIPPTTSAAPGHTPETRAAAAQYLHKRGAADIADMLDLTTEYDTAAGGQTHG